MKKYILTTIAFVCIALLMGGHVMPVASSGAPSVFDPKTVQNVMDHSLAIIAYYEVSADRIDKVIAYLQATGIVSKKVSPNWPLAIKAQDEDKKEVVAVLGSATLLKGGYAITVAHLFEVDDDAGNPLKLLRAWAVQRSADHVIAVEVVAKTDLGLGNAFWNDYCLIKLQEDLKLPDVRIADVGLRQGDPVMFVGCVNGAVFLARFGFATEFTFFFRKDDKNTLHLSRWTDFPMLCVYPGGGGDSGGGIFNTAGELVGVMYCGIELGLEQYVFSNPLSHLKEFLRAHNPEGLVTK